MKLKKILTAIAATAVMTSLFAIGASAAGEITNVSYEATSGKVSFTLPAYTADQKTLLIVKTGADGSYNLGALLDTDIMQIDQNGTGWTEAQLAKNLAVGTKFVVLSGGNGTLYSSAVYAVPGGDEPELILVGDVNGSGEVNGLDAAALAKYVATVGTIEDKYYNAADVNDNGEVNGLDAAALAKYIANVGDLCCQYTKDKTTTATPPTAE